MHLRRGLVLSVLSGVLTVIAPARAEGQSRLACASGVRVNGRTATLVHLMLVVPDGADAGQVGRAALARAGVRPLASSDPSPSFELMAVRWPQFFDGSPKDDLVTDLYRPDGQSFGGSADAAVAAAGQTWTDVPTATFALGFGGETSIADGFDGVNVLDWPSSWMFDGALAVTIATFDVATGFILDADVLFSPYFPFSLDPQPGEFVFDFQRVVLHEDGHVAGLGHSADPSAVMYPFLGPGPQSHTLAQDDIDAISTLYPLEFRPLPPPRPEPQPNGGPPPKVGVIARLGDPAPGGGLFDFDFEPYRLNERGEVAFAADFFDPVTFVGGEGVFLDEGPQIRSLARTGDPAPGGGVFGAGVWINVGLDARGDGAFAFALGPELLLPLGMNSGVYRWDSASKALSAVVVPGVTPAPTGGVFLGAYDHAVLDDLGQVAFAGIVPTGAGTSPGLGLGVFLARPDGTIGAVAAPGDPAPGGGVFDLADVPALGAAGALAFGAHVSGEECLTNRPQSFVLHCDESLYLRRPDGTIVSIVHARDPAPGGGTFRSAFGPVMNAAGDILFLGDLSIPPRRLAAVGAFLFSGGSIAAVALPGQEMPGGGHLVRTALQYGNWSLNGQDEVAFSAQLDTDSLGLGVLDTGLYLWSGGSLHVIARTGMEFPGLGTLVKLAPPLFNGPLGGALLNGRGDVVFQGTFMDQNGAFTGALLKASTR